MTEEKITDIVLQITSSLAELNANMRNVLDKLTNHESRLTRIESTRTTEKKESGDGWKNELLMLLARAVVIGGVAIAGLAGAGGILSQIFQK